MINHLKNPTRMQILNLASSNPPGRKRLVTNCTGSGGWNKKIYRVWRLKQENLLALEAETRNCTEGLEAETRNFTGWEAETRECKGSGGWNKKIYWLWRLKQETVQGLDAITRNCTGSGGWDKKLYRVWRMKQETIHGLESKPRKYTGTRDWNKKLFRVWTL